MESFYRSFLRTPYPSSLGRGKKRYGGKITRFGAPLSGNANPKWYKGSPSGGAEGVTLNPLFFDQYKIGGFKHSHRTVRRHSRHRRGRGRDLTGLEINPQNAYRHTYPLTGTVIF